MLVKVKQMKWILIFGGLALLVPQFDAVPAYAQKPGTPGFQVETRQQREKRIAWQKRRAEIRAERKREKCLANPEGGVSLMRNALRWSDAPVPALHLRP